LCADPQLWDLLYRVLAVALTAASPVGEVLVAIPVGVALGLDPLLAWAVSVPSNIAPAASILYLFGWLGARFPGLSRFFAGRGSSVISRLGSSRLSIAIFLATPFAGVYAVSFASGVLGVGRRLSLLCQLAGVSVFGLAEALLILFGFSMLRLYR